ncbi:TIGR02588 family protein [Aphanothece hegewaldii CCALA 016]|uniref:TIGR02588 family protein n=1 Tax=Aphanothece hegewaldii CCALA 016 TaxID=2107694 RepID=A0A2T1M1Z6_9CHRO|nr:TIGR02588 family protein [Aphanothece hegewaldii]PSF38727.1 TIGR02588 family protein [Aphanothece hegewaldii CCALA 016]
MSKKTPYKSLVDRSKNSFPAEWVTFAIAFLIVLSIVGLVLYTWITSDQQPPILSIERQEIREAQGQFYVPFKITNTGGETAESVQVIGEFRMNGKIEEVGEQQFDFLSGGEKEEGAFIFTRNPKNGELVLRVASYKLP